MSRATRLTTRRLRGADTAEKGWLRRSRGERVVAYGVCAVVCVLVFATVAIAAPTTSITIDAAAGLNGWYVSNPVVTLTTGGPGTTYYSLASDTGPWTTYGGPFSIGEGTKTLWYYSVDEATDAEAVKSHAFKVDTIAPNATFTAPALEAAVAGALSVQGTATDANFASYRLEYGAGKRPLPADPEIGNLRYGTWWRTFASSVSPVLGAELGLWDTSAADNSYHTLRLIAQDQAGNTTVRLRAVRVSNTDRPWLDEVTVDALDFVPDMSANGLKIAWSSDRLGTQDIWTAAANGTQLKAITTFAGQERHPSFSPDGQSIVFMSDAYGTFDIWKMNVDGTGLTRLTSDAGDESVPVWSAGGTKVVYSSDVAGTRDIYIMNADGSGQTALTSGPSDDWLPDISPDGSKIAFSSDRIGGRRAFLVNADGTGLTTVAAVPGGEIHPSFSPDGQKLALVGSTGGDIWTVNVNGTGLKKLTTDPAPESMPTWNASGSKIIFASARSGLCDIYTMNPDGSGQARVTFSTDDFIPDVNRDGSKVAFASNRARDNTPFNWYDNPRGDVFLSDPDGSNVNRLMGISSYASHPSFGPSGAELAFVSDMSGAWHIWKMGLDGSGLQQLTSSVTSENVPTWGPSGKIVYASNALGSDDIFIMNDDGTSQAIVTNAASSDRFPDISTTGSMVGFSSDRFDLGDVFTSRPDGTSETRLTADATAEEWHPSFGPGGTQLTYTNNNDIYLMGVDGTRVTQLTRDTALDSVNTWGADGRTMVFATSRTSGNIGKKSIWRMTLKPDPVAPPDDTTPPVTALEATPASPDGDNGWYVTDPSVTLTADEPGITYFSFDGDAGPWTAYGGPFSVGEGEKTVWYYSVDGVGNAETVKSQAFRVDLTPPMVAIDSPADGATIPAIVSVSGTTEADTPVALTIGDGVTELNFTTTAASDGTWSVPDVDLSSLADGAIRFQVTATDRAGNASAPAASNATKYVPAAPIVGPIVVPVDPVPVGSAVNVMATFTDLNPSDTHTAVWSWLDGTSSAGSVAEAGGSGTINGSHIYTTPGVYTVAVTVTDQTGLSGSATALQYIVVYDADGGFVTGGGWITSPAGASAAYPVLSGRANFGFVSKYKKGSNVPTGETQFSFQLGDLNFHSESYSWLVIAGGKAQYKGVGTVNGTGNYGFMLTAIDGAIRGGTDTFRIKIWDLDAGDAIVYDNQAGASDATDPTTALRGGSVVIHK